MRNQGGAASLHTKKLNTSNSSGCSVALGLYSIIHLMKTKSSSLALWAHLAAVASPYDSHALGSDQAKQRCYWLPKIHELRPNDFGQGAKCRGLEFELWVLSPLITWAWLFGLSDRAQRVESMILGWLWEIWHGGLGVGTVGSDWPVCSQSFSGRLMHLKRLLMGQRAHEIIH